MDKIPEISSSEECSIYQFDKNDLAKDGVISFTLESIYKNINIYSNLQYSKNKIYQEKTINFLKQLTLKKKSFNSISIKEKPSAQRQRVVNNNTYWFLGRRSSYEG